MRLAAGQIAAGAAGQRSEFMEGAGLVGYHDGGAGYAGRARRAEEALADSDRVGLRVYI